MLQNWAPRLYALLIPILIIAVAACSDDGDTQDPDDILDNAAEAFEELQSASFVLDIDGSIGIDAEGMLQLGAVEGEIARPASARADASVQLGGTSITMEMLASDGEMYLRNLLTGEWERAPTDLRYDPARIFDEDDGISAIIARLDDLDYEGQDSVGGVSAHHLTATVDTASVRALAGDFFEGERLVVNIWVARDDYRLLGVELNDTEADDPMSWELTLTNHDEPVEITPPDLG
jgi:hypothetical protein